MRGFPGFFDEGPGVALEVFEALAGDGRDDVEGEILLLAEGLEFFEAGGVLGGIELGGDDDLGFFEELFAEAGEFVLDDVIGVDGAIFVELGEVDEVEQDAGALDVAEEGDAEAVAFAGTFDEARDVGHDEGFAAEFIHGNNAEYGLFGGEGVGGDFGFGGGKAADESALASVRETDEADVGEELHFEAEREVLTGDAVFFFSRGLVGGGGEVLVATTAATAFGDNELLAVEGEVVDLLAGVPEVNDGADGDFDDEGVTVATGAIGAFSVATAVGGVLRVHAEVEEGVVVAGSFKNDIAAATAVAARGAATGYEFLAPEGGAAVAAVATAYVDFRFVDEF